MKIGIEKTPHLRICVTEKCPLVCFYCRPGGEACRIVNKKEMSLRQMYQLVKILADRGITHLKITGGEPLLRKDIPEMILALKSIKGIMDIQLVTRSPKAGNMTEQLRDSGLNSVTISLDSLNPFTFYRISQNSRLDLLLKAIKKIHKSGLSLQFNMVVMRGVNEHEIPKMIEYAGRYGAVLKLLDLMNIPGDPKFLDYYYMSFDQIVIDLKEKAVSCNIETPSGGVGTPMPKFLMPSGTTVLIKDAKVGTWYGDVCKECKNFPCQDAIMALRLTADGSLQRCLLRRDNLVDLLSMVENFESEDKIKRVVDSVLNTFRKAVYHEKTWRPKN